MLGKKSLVLGMLFMVSSEWALIDQPAFGEETTTPQFPDRLKIWGGYQYLFGLDPKVRMNLHGLTPVVSFLEFHASHDPQSGS